MKIKTVILLLISALLASCAAVVVVGAAGGMVVYDRRSMATIERDARIFYVINTTLANDQRFRGSRIVITSFNHVVLLSGQTPTASLRVVAEQIAKSAPRVERVYDEITVDYPLSFSQRSKDTLITGQVRSKMLTQKGLESGSIRVVTENGVVYLMGIATHEQANLAVDVARHINGVSRVVKIFKYIV